MLSIAGMTSFLVALLLWLLVAALRRSAAARKLIPHARQLLDELGAPQRLLTLYLLVRLALFFPASAGQPVLGHALRGAEVFFGSIALLRVADALLFAFLRSRGQQGAPRILRSLAVWLATFVIAAAVTRMEYQLDLSSLFATSALLSVVLGFALQETLGNLFAGLTLHAEHPFEQGEWVSFGKYTGRIIDVGWRSTRLITLDEDELLVPNSMIAREVVVNHSRPSSQDCVELNVRLDLDASPARARQVLLEAVTGCARVLRDPAPTVELAAFHDDGVDYRLRFHCKDYGEERAVLDEVQQALWYALRRAAIELPYKQTTISVRERASEAEERRRKEHLAEAEDLLGRIDFVAALSDDARKTLAERARYLEYGPGEAVVRQGESGESFYLVARGEVAVRVRVEGGEKEVARLSRGAFFGEMSLLTGEPRTATVLALADAGLLAVDREAFSRVFAADPNLAQELAHVITSRRLALASARAEGVAPQLETEERNLISRIRSIFGFKKAAG